MIIKESAENYLESILVLSQKYEYVRAADICNYFGYSRPTVSNTIKQFKEHGYIEVNSKHHITLTKKGLEIAEKVHEKHNVIANFLMEIGVSRETALEDACKLEHGLSDESFEALKAKFPFSKDHHND